MMLNPPEYFFYGLDSISLIMRNCFNIERELEIPFAEFDNTACGVKFLLQEITEEEWARTVLEDVKKQDAKNVILNVQRSYVKSMLELFNNYIMTYDEWDNEETYTAKIRFIESHNDLATITNTEIRNVYTSRGLNVRQSHIDVFPSDPESIELDY